MGFATAIAICLFAQLGDSSEYSLNQWESRLLESRWTLIDPTADCPRLLLVLKHHPSDYRTFELYLYDWVDDELWRTIEGPWRADVGPWRTVEAWTGTYKMQSRENHDRSISEKLVQLNVDQHWLSVDSSRLARIGMRVDEHGRVTRRCPRPRTEWIEELALLHWTEESDFKPFLAEMKLDTPAPAEPIPAESVKFLLRSNDVLNVGWWTIGTQYALSPVQKWRRSPLPFRTTRVLPAADVLQDASLIGPLYQGP